VGEGFETTTWDKALNIVLEEINRIKSDSPEGVAFIGSPILTNEELYLLKKLAGVLGINNVTSNSGKSGGGKRFGLISSDPFPNSTGVRDMGLASDSDGLSQTTRSIFEGRIKALFVLGEDLFQITPPEERARLAEALSKLSFIGVEDFKLTETVKMAHVILPGASPYEKEGTFTNDQGRVQRVKKAISPPGDAKPDWEILTLLGKRVQKESFDYTNPSQVMLEISEKVPSYKGMDCDKIGMLGIKKVE